MSEFTLCSVLLDVKKKFDDILSRLGTVHECDEQTDMIDRHAVKRIDKPQICIIKKNLNAHATILVFR